MARLGRTITDLSRKRRAWADLLGTADGGRAQLAPSRLRKVKHFGGNPGNLRMLKHMPDSVRPNPALVVVLHGCTQTAAGYDHGAGWSTIADQYGFALLMPEQKRANNPNSCFNWFDPGDTRRDAGEALSIRQMVERMVADHRIDRSRIFVTGLSAGGAMTSVMLASYPDVFAGGAIIAGLPYGAATNVQEAFESMFKGRGRSAREWGDLVRGASRHNGPWPKVSVWHGTGDKTVAPINGAEIVKQWTDVHGLAGARPVESAGPGFSRQVWRDARGQEIIESFTIANMAHGTPLATGEGDGRYGAAGPFLLEVGLSSTYHIAKFWGLTDARDGAEIAPVARLSRRDAVAPANAAEVLAAERQSSRADSEDDETAAAPSRLPVDVHGVITKALRAAGLMRH